MKSTVELKHLELKPSLGTYGPDDVVPDVHLLDLKLAIDPKLVLINADCMDRVFDYDPLIAEIGSIASDGHYHAQERLLTRIVAACAAYEAIEAVDICLSKRPVLRDSGYGFFGQMYDASGNIVGAEFQVNTYTSNNQMQPDISGLSDDEFVVTRHSRNQDGDETGIFGQKFDASGNKADSEFQVNTHTTSSQDYSAVTSLTDGGFVVTWHDDSGHDGSANGVFGQKYTSSGSASGSQFQINSKIAGTQAFSSITSLTDGGFVVTWTGFDASGNGFYAQRYSASGEKDGSEFRANTYQNGHEMHSEVTSLNDGGYVVIWYSDTHTDDTNYGVHGQRFDASGAADGSQFLVDTDVSNAQQYPEIASLADGGFVVTWQSYTQDGSNYEIYAQRFDAGLKTTISRIDAAIRTVNTQRSELSAFSNSLSHTVDNLTNAVANISVAKGKIEDANFAIETTKLAKEQLLQQAAIAMLAQANAAKQNVLTLLEG